jgi:2'-5' RNA ligase
VHAVVSLLDPAHYRRVEALWAELAERFGVRGVYVTPYPHFSYQTAAAYDVARLEPILQRVARETTPFTVRTAGLGVFTGAHPVLTIAVARSPALARLHAVLWEALSPVVGGVSTYYHPDAWLPHITIGFGDVTPETLGEIVRVLATHDFNWEIPVTDLGLIYDHGTGQEMRLRFGFGGRAVNELGHE